MITINTGRWIAGFFLLVMIFCTAPVQAGPVTVFSDNFNDNSLDTAKWTADVVGTNNLFREQNQRAEFTTYGPNGGGWHAYLNSVPLAISGWDSIEITGRWTNTGYTSRTHIAKITDLNNPASYISVEYAAWGIGGPDHPTMFYYWNGGSGSADARKPSPGLVPYRLKITKTGFEYFENEILLKNIPTTSMAGAERFQVHIGAWEYSSIQSQTYIDDIVVTADIPLVDAAVPVPEFPSAFLPAAMIIGFFGAVLIISRTREH